MKLRRSTKMLLPLALMVLLAWVASNIWTLDLQIASAAEFGLRSHSGFVGVRVTTGPGAVSYLVVHRDRHRGRMPPLLRTSFLPTMQHTRLMAPGGALIRNRYELTVPYWYLLDAVLLIWVPVWWRAERGRARRRSLKPEAT